ncbi:MAG: hypothetical protein KDA81_18685 [Planctomycetaceae bacterium]|nr:hypothetical protein [Planctomycetaceae bacterium]
MTSQTLIFQCSSSTYLDCVDKNVFGSNQPWPLQVRVGDYCLLHHYEIGGLLGLWQATTDGGKNLVPKLWGGKFPYQVKVKLVIPKVMEVPKTVLRDLGIDAAVARFDPVLDEDMAEDLIRSLCSDGAEK